MAQKELTIIVDEEILDALVVADLRRNQSIAKEHIEDGDETKNAFEVVLDYYGFPER